MASTFVSLPKVLVIHDLLCEVARAEEDMRGPVNKICESCSEAFECGQYRCWCGQIGITEQQMDWIEKSFRDCLCLACLKKVVSGELSSDRAPGAQ
jgi:hypothetical protein